MQTRWKHGTASATLHSAHCFHLTIGDSKSSLPRQHPLWESGDKSKSLPKAQQSLCCPSSTRLRWILYSDRQMGYCGWVLFRTMTLFAFRFHTEGSQLPSIVRPEFHQLLSSVQSGKNRCQCNGQPGHHKEISSKSKMRSGPAPLPIRARGAGSASKARP